jgi:hypothetical protein
VVGRELRASPDDDDLRRGFQPLWRARQVRRLIPLGGEIGRWAATEVAAVAQSGRSPTRHQITPEPETRAGAGVMVVRMRLALAGRVHRNAPCPCGSGERFRKCHQGFITRFIQSISREDRMTFIVMLDRMRGSSRKSA